MAVNLHLGPTLGANEIGTLISSVFLGITTVQLYIYYKNEFKDPFWIRFLIGAVWIMEVLHTVFLWGYIYDLTVTNYGNPAVITTSPWMLFMSSLFLGLIGGIVQAYFAYRIYVFSGHLLLPVIAWMLSATQLAADLAVTILGGRMSLQDFATRFSWIVLLSIVVNLVVDFLNTGGLCYFLLKKRSHNRIKQTVKIVDRLMFWSLETCLVTSIASVLMLALFLGSPNTFLWIGVSFFYHKLYSNCLMASLNGRATLRDNINNDPYLGTSLGALETNVSKQRGDGNGVFSTEAITVTIQTNSHCDT